MGNVIKFMFRVCLAVIGAVLIAAQPFLIAGLVTLWLLWLSPTMFGILFVTGAISAMIKSVWLGAAIVGVMLAVWVLWRQHRIEKEGATIE